ncbi:hypothetical protein HS125_04745 [bacterium]|nr:hypothetical protein [bacterium]
MPKRSRIALAVGAILLFSIVGGASGLIRKEQIEDAYVRKPSDGMAGTLTVAHVKSSTGTNTLGGNVDLAHSSQPTLTFRSNDAATAQPDGFINWYGATWGAGVVSNLARIVGGKDGTTDNQQRGFLSFHTLRDGDNTLWEWVRLHQSGFLELEGRASAGAWSVPLVISNKVAADNTGAGLAFSLRGDLDPALYQKCMIVLDGVNDGGLGWGRGYLKILMNNTSSSVNATLSDAVLTIDNLGNLSTVADYTLGDAGGDQGRLHGGVTIGTTTGANTCKVVGRLEGYVIPLVFSTTDETISGGGYGYYGALRGDGSRGWVAPGAGSVCAVSGSYATTALANDIEVRRNGTSLWSVGVQSEQALADVYKSRAKDSAAFSKGDHIEVYFGAGVYNSVITVLVAVDTWDDDGVEEN